MKRGLLTILVLLLTFGLASAADYIRLDADAVDPSTTATLDFIITRECPTPTLIAGASNGWIMNATGSASWTFNDFVKYHDVDWWNLGGLLFSNYVDGVPPDTFLTGGAALMAGMPTVTEEPYFGLVLDFGAGSGELCLDSGFVNPAGAWKWSQMTCGLGGNGDRPLFLDKSGSDDNHPICITVGTACPGPTINVTPAGDELGGSHCNTLNFTFGADPGSGQTITGWTVLSGPGTIDAGGNYSVGPLATGTYPVVVQVENSCPATDDYAFTVNFVNSDPTWTNTGGEATSITAGQLYSYDFDASDIDACDNLEYAINSVAPTPTNTPQMNATTGLLEWTTDLADAGTTFNFEIQVLDIEPTKAAVTYQFAVEVLEPECTDPTINVTPPADELAGNHCAASFQFGADPGTFGGEPATIAGWAVISGPGSIDASGLYTVATTTASASPVTIEVTNSCGGTNQYAFTTDLQNTLAEITNEGSAPTSVSAGEQYTFDFEFSEADTCDEDNFTLGTVSPAPINTPTIDLTTGLFQWLSDASEAGTTFNFDIRLFDEGMGDYSDIFTLSIEVTALVCTPPTINVTPASDNLEGSHCGVQFQFGADPGLFGEDPATIAGWAVTSGPGSIDGAGLYSVSNTTAISTSVTVEVTNSCGETDDYVFSLNLTNDPAVFTNTGSEPGTVSAGGLYSFDFDATDPDACDGDPTFSITSTSPVPINTPTIDANTGLFQWQSDASEAGQTFSFNIAVYDAGMDDLSDFYGWTVEVSALECTAPTINVTPDGDVLMSGHCLAAFEFDADPGMYGPDPATIASWAVTAGPGTIDGSGLYTVSNPTEWSTSVTIQVINSCGSDDFYTFTLNLMTANPVFTNADGAPTSITAGNMYSYDFDAYDPDDCDTPTFGLGAVTPATVNMPTVDETTGLFQWMTHTSEGGMSFDFEIIAYDAGAAKANTIYVLSVDVVGVAPEAEIQLDPAYFYFTKEQGAPEPPSQTLNISNIGSGTLNWNLANDSSWLVPSITSGTAPSAVTLDIAAGNRPVGDYRDTIFVSGNAINSPQFAIVDLEITEPPVEFGDTVWVGSTSGYPGDQVVVPVEFRNVEDLSLITLPLTFYGPDKFAWNGLTCDSVSWIGSRADYVATKPVSIDNTEQNILAGVIVMSEPLIPVGKGLMANLYFTISAAAAPKVVPIDSTFIAPDNSLLFADGVGDPIYPEFTAGEIEILMPLEPCVALSDSHFTFVGYECGQNPAPQYFDVINCGPLPFCWEIVDRELLPAGGVTFDPMVGCDDATVEISVDIDCLEPGTYYDSACVVLTGGGKCCPPGFQACMLIEVIIEEPPAMDIAGVVYEEGTSDPIGNAVVELYDMFPSSLIATTMSDPSDGSFNFGPYSGSYTVRTYKTGYYQTFEHITAPNVNVELYLMPTESPNPTFEWVNLFCDYATFEEYPILPGDVVEAYDPTGVLCGQYFVTVEGMYGFMPVYRDDSLTTPGFDEGCDPGDPITVKLNGYDMTSYLDAPVSWTTNGDNIEACFDGYEEREICIHLDKGWNLISWNVNTDVDDIEVLFADIMDSVVVILSFEQGALTYDPDLPGFSTLNMADEFHGYWVNMRDTATICFKGSPVDPSTPIPLEMGWNLASYLPTEADSTPDALASIYPELILAMGYYGEGVTWDPLNPDPSTMRYMDEGYGYWLKVATAVDLIYGGVPVAVASVVADNTAMKSNTLSYVTPTNRWIDVYGSNVTVDGKRISTGTVVEAVSEFGTVCGAFVVHTTGMLGFMPVYGDDATTGSVSEGPSSGETFHLVVNGVETEETFTWTSHADRIEIGALNSLGGGNITVPAAYQLHQNFPNPFNPKTAITYDLGDGAHVTVAVYNILGEAVKVLVDEYQPAGDGYQVIWDGTDRNGMAVSSGVYFYKLSAGDFSETKKMMLMK